MGHGEVRAEAAVRGAAGLRTVDADAFEQTCLQVLDEVAATREPIVVAKRGRPVARLVPIFAERTAWLGSMRGRGGAPPDIDAYRLHPAD